MSEMASEPYKGESPYVPQHAAYVPKYANPEQWHAEQQMDAGEDYYYAQARKRYRAEYILKFGPFGQDVSESQAERFARRQRRSIAKAAGRQALAAQYTQDMGVKAGLRE